MKHIDPAMAPFGMESFLRLILSIKLLSVTARTHTQNTHPRNITISINRVYPSLLRPLIIHSVDHLGTIRFPLFDGGFVDETPAPPLMGIRQIARIYKHLAAVAEARIHIETAIVFPLLQHLAVGIIPPKLITLATVAVIQEDLCVGDTLRHVPTQLTELDPQVPVPGKLEELVRLRLPLILRTGVQADRLLLAVIERVDAERRSGHTLDGTVRKVRRLYRWILFHQIERHVRHEPLEGFALQLLPDGQLLRNVSHVRVVVLFAIPHVQILLVLVHPHLGHAFVVPREEILFPRITERSVPPVDVANARTGCIVHLATALPDLEAQLVLLATPDVQPLVVATDLPEELGTDREQTTGHDGAFERFRWIRQILG
uniref:Putative secreted protein n=1 Tax=Anopheles marajoara TaxID=58244 RepID=A0A2M4C5I6_9DIPT